jgi:hypothetical protein
MQADASADSHEIWHGRASKGSSLWAGIAIQGYVCHDNITLGINIVSVETRYVVFVFLQNREAARRRGIALTTTGNRRSPHLDTIFEKYSTLGGEIDLDGRRAQNTVSSPNPFLAGF